MWYGLVRDGELIAVNYFSERFSPSPLDFHVGYYSSRHQDEIVEVDVTIKQYLETYM